MKTAFLSVLWKWVGLSRSKKTLLEIEEERSKKEMVESLKKLLDNLVLAKLKQGTRKENLCNIDCLTLCRRISGKIHEGESTGNRELDEWFKHHFKKHKTDLPSESLVKNTLAKLSEKAVLS